MSRSAPPVPPAAVTALALQRLGAYYREQADVSERLARTDPKLSPLVRSCLLHSAEIFVALSWAMDDAAADGTERAASELRALAADWLGDRTVTLAPVTPPEVVPDVLRMADDGCPQADVHHH